MFPASLTNASGKLPRNASTLRSDALLPNRPSPAATSADSLPKTPHAASPSSISAANDTMWC